MYRVAREGFVPAHDRNTLRKALRNDQTVKGIAVVEGQGRECIQVCRPYRKELDCISFHLMLDEFRKRDLQFQPADADLDGPLPQAGNTQQPFIFNLFDQPARGCARVRSAASSASSDSWRSALSCRPYA